MLPIVDDLPTNITSIDLFAAMMAELLCVALDTALPGAICGRSALSQDWRRQRSG